MDTTASTMSNVTSITAATDPSVERLADQRAQLRVRHAAALTALMEERTDLKGVHALADHFDDAVRWSA